MTRTARITALAGILGVFVLGPALVVQAPGYVAIRYACHEGNNAMRNILSGARAAEK
jgi:hypothetical protein